VSITIRQSDAKDFPALFKLDQKCFPVGIAYSKTMLKHFMAQPGAECLVAVNENEIVAFLLTEENPPLGHVMTLDVAEAHRRNGIGSLLLRESEKQFAISWRAHDAARNRNHERSGRCLLAAPWLSYRSSSKKLLSRAFGCVRNAQALAGDEGANGLNEFLLSVLLGIVEDSQNLAGKLNGAFADFRSPAAHQSERSLLEDVHDCDSARRDSDAADLFSRAHCEFLSTFRRANAEIARF